MSDVLARLGGGLKLGNVVEGAQQQFDRQRRNRLLDLQEAQGQAEMDAAAAAAERMAQGRAMLPEAIGNPDKLAALAGISPEMAKTALELRSSQGKERRAQGTFDREGETHTRDLKKADLDINQTEVKLAADLFAGVDPNDPEQVEAALARGGDLFDEDDKALFRSNPAFVEQLKAAGLGVEGVNKNEQAGLDRTLKTDLQNDQQAFTAGQNAANRASLEQRARDRAAAGPQTVVNNTIQPTKGESLLGKEVDARDIRTQQEGIGKMRGLLPDMERLMIAIPNFNTGTGSEARLAAGKLLDALGMPESFVEGVAGGDISEGEVIQAIQARLAPAMRVPGSGASSDRDVNLFMQSLPNLARTPEGNRKIIQNYRKIMDRQQEILMIKRRSMSEHQHITPEAWDQINNLPSVFSEDEIAAMTSGPADNASTDFQLDPGTEAMMNKWLTQ